MLLQISLHNPAKSGLCCLALKITKNLCAAANPLYLTHLAPACVKAISAQLQAQAKERKPPSWCLSEWEPELLPVEQAIVSGLFWFSVGSPCRISFGNALYARLYPHISAYPCKMDGTLSRFLRVSLLTCCWSRTYCRSRSELPLFHTLDVSCLS